MMCGRYTLSAGHEALARAFLAEFAAELQAEWKPRYNIAPGTGITAIIEDRDRDRLRRAEVLHWGLVPRWADDPAIGYKLINARAETVASKPSYRDPFRYRRCLVPASGFFEWDRRHHPRQPWYFFPGERECMALAGVWEHWLHPSGSEILSVALLTTEADDRMAPIHHRMPVILPEAAWADWLDTRQVKPDMPAFLKRRPGPEFLQCHPVSMEVNRGTAEGSHLIEPVEWPHTPDETRKAEQQELF